jgi:hypothetical protein
MKAGGAWRGSPIDSAIGRRYGGGTAQAFSAASRSNG